MSKTRGLRFVEFGDSLDRSWICCYGQLTAWQPGRNEDDLGMFSEFQMCVATGLVLRSGRMGDAPSLPSLPKLRRLARS
jgi:hypothetical protein